MIDDIFSNKKKKISGPHTFDIANLFHCAADNIGDQMCGPAQHLWGENSYNLPLQPPQQNLKNAIIGGGQIFSQLGSLLWSIYDKSPKAKIVVWGVGVPLKGKREEFVSDISQRVALFGTRNYDRRDQFAFVPCASCLSPLFDQVEEPKHEVVFFFHRKKGAHISVPPGAPVMTNAMCAPKKAINFIASGETIVTSSYHGVYWAQLLGRRVICLPFSEKFETFQHRPWIADPESWQDGLKMAHRVSPITGGV